MKKITTPPKLTLKLETVKALKLVELTRVVGGATGHCQETTTVLLTGSC